MFKFPILKLLPYVTLIVGYLNRLYPLPSLDDSAGCRDWLRDLLRLGDELADKSETPIDDDIVQFLQKLVEDDDAWELAIDLLQMAVRHDDGDGDKIGLPADATARADLIGEKVGIAPLVIFEIVTAILALIRQFRK